MLTVSFETDAAACRELWERLIPAEKITDLWDVRACFHKHYKREFLFIVAKEGGDIVGFIPLCFIKEHDYYGYFPGEVWQKKTWLEQNRLIARDRDVLAEMFRRLQDDGIRYYLRYLCPNPHLSEESACVDEIGYLFYPHAYDYSIDAYYSTFSRKSIKTIRREVDRMYAGDLTVHSDRVDDFEEMLRLNMERFGENSYFADRQFAESFRALRDYLDEKGMLIMTTVVIGGRVAAVDMGCVYKGDYTLLAGGTHAGFPGVAKLINLHHMRAACKNRYHSVDFLCGDFAWKKIFRLSEKPLFMASNLNGEGHG